MLTGDISIEDFERVVDLRWKSGHFILKAPETASSLEQQVGRKLRVDARYGSDLPHLQFISQWLVGAPGKPGAIYIQAPPEEACSPRQLSQLNRSAHEHDSGRIALIMSGHAIFHVARQFLSGDTAIIDIPVTTGDLLLWPARTPHTFDACEGFCLVSAMANYVSPAEDGFTYPVTTRNIDQFKHATFDDVESLES